jgi:hypothetical protein
LPSTSFSVITFASNRSLFAAPLLVVYRLEQLIE